MPRLTKTVVDQFTATKDTTLWDSLLPGFGVRMRSGNPQKVFYVQYRTPAGQRKRRLGVYGVLTVDEARDLARHWLAQVAMGHDPALPVRAPAVTVEALATRSSAVVQARIPLALVRQAEARAAREGCTVSDLLRLGLARLLASDAMADASSDTSQSAPVELSDAVRLAIDQAVQEAVERALQGVRQPPPVRRARHDVPPPDAPVSGASYDGTKFYLATLCKRGHDWQGTGQSLLRRGNSNCVQCQQELRRARDATKIR